MALSKKAIAVSPYSEHFQRTIQLLEKVQPSSDLQFTFADIIEALALSEGSDLFTATPIKPCCITSGFIIPVDSAASNILYYNRVDREAFKKALMHRISIK